MKKIDTICVIDDDEIYQFIIKKEIESTKLFDKIITFSNGEDAINFFQNLSENSKELPDVILLDINMPVLDGWQFLDEYALLKPRLTKKIIIYLVTSSVDERDMEHTKKINEISDYIVKPVTRQKLITMFSQISDQLSIP
jgi:CheY-like chemotaxis protein